MAKYNFGEGCGKTFKVRASAESNTKVIPIGKWFVVVQTDTVEISKVKESMGPGEGTPLPPNTILERVDVYAPERWCFRSNSGQGVVWFTEIA